MAVLKKLEVMKTSSSINRMSNFIKQFKYFFRNFFKLPFYIFAIPMILLIRLIRPWILIRLGSIASQRIGHFAGDVEVYLCEKDAGINVPNQLYFDIFFWPTPECNKQLAIMWQRVLNVWPAFIMGRVYRINQLIPGGIVHSIPFINSDRDVNNLFDQSAPHIQFTAEEEIYGKNYLHVLGVSDQTKFICLIVRDDAYLKSALSHRDWSYHNYRDADIQNYMLAAEMLAERGYFVIRMGKKMNNPINIKHPRIIDYAFSNIKNDFMDIYLMAHCNFCITSGTGLDAVADIFRRPICQTNILPIAYHSTFSNRYINITRHHIDSSSNRELSLSEIFSYNSGDSALDKSNTLNYIENTPEEISDVCIEMVERLNGKWKILPDEDLIQSKFRKVFLQNISIFIKNKSLHGEIRSRFGTKFLQNNLWWVQ